MKAKPNKKLFIQYFNQYYSFGLALAILIYAFSTLYNSEVNNDYKFFLFLLSFGVLTSYSDIMENVKWLPFLIFSIPLLIFIQYINIHGYELWGKMLHWQMNQKIIIDLNPIFQKIPLNDAAFTRVFQTESLTKFMRLVYQNGFVVPALVPIYRAMVAKDLRKMLRYLLSAHVFQVFLITPFYLSFHLQEVWYVLGHPDGMARNLSPEAAAGATLNCFPSMHTSIAFAMFLVVLHEKNRLFKWVWGFFCLSIIFSTMYLEIHWVIDVLAGMLLAYLTVKLTDIVLNKASKPVLFVSKFFYFTSSNKRSG